MAPIKRNILTSREVLFTKFFFRIINSCFAKNDAFQNKDFWHLNVRLSEKKWYMFLKIYQVSADEKIG